MVDVYSQGIGKLKEIDKSVMDILDQVINAANETIDSPSNVQIDEGAIDYGDSPDTIVTGPAATGLSTGEHDSLNGYGGVELKEHAKDAIQTLTSNLAGATAHELQMRKIIELQVDDGDDDDTKNGQKGDQKD